ncbi:MAG: hypothetical protein ABI697_14100 [Devosia sp.]
MRGSMSPAREEALSAVKAGDVIFGVAAGGQEKLLLVYAVTPTSISARHVTTQMLLTFGRDGRTRPVPGGGSCVITSTAALPAKNRAVVLGLDTKMRVGRDYPDFVLSKDEIELLLTYDTFFKANPLPD